MVSLNAAVSLRHRSMGHVVAVLAWWCGCAMICGTDLHRRLQLHLCRAQRFLAFTGSSQGIKAFCEFSEQIPFGHTRGFLDR